jgi:hypothetical protein
MNVSFLNGLDQSLACVVGDLGKFDCGNSSARKLLRDIESRDIYILRIFLTTKPT